MSLSLLLLGIAALCGVVLFQRYARFRPGDMIALAGLASVALYLSRFDRMLIVEFFGRPYRSALLYVAVLGLGLLLTHPFRRRESKLEFSPFVVLGAIFAYLSLISGLINGGWEGVGSTLQVMTFIFAPMLLGAMLVAITPRDRDGLNRLRLSFIMLGGLITAGSQLITSLLAPLISSLLGWNSLLMTSQSGTLRGWSPLGGPVATGFVLVMAYGFALHEVLGRGRRIYTLALGVMFVSLLFTLSRSAVVMLLVFHVVYFWRSLRRRPITVAAAAAACLVLAFGTIQLLEQRFDLSRLVSTHDTSTVVRADSAVAALMESLDSPLFGKGPGLLYTDVRTIWLEARTAPRGGNPELERTFVLNNRLSAQEPHNLYLYLMAEHGWLAALVFCALFVVAIWRSRPPASASSELTSLSSTVQGLWAGSLFMFLTASGPMVNPKVSVFFWTFAFYGLLVQRVEQDEVDAPVWSLRPVPATDPAAPGEAVAVTRPRRGATPV